MARPRSKRAHEQVLNAALKLFAERGIDATSMDAIAETSKVSKATIYKHWPDKDALCLEVMAYLHGLDQEPPAPDSGDIRADMVAVLSHRPQEQRSDLRVRMMPHLMAYAFRNPAFGQAWRARVLEPPRVQLIELLKHGIAEGDLPQDLDFDLAVAVLLGPMMYRHVLNIGGSKVPENWAERVVAGFWKAYADKSTAARHKQAPHKKERHHGLPTRATQSRADRLGPSV
jgi:AcrR family transcriptional regulator